MGEWRLPLCRELRAAGYEVDFNKVARPMVERCCSAMKPPARRRGMKRIELFSFCCRLRSAETVHNAKAVVYTP